MKEALYVAKRSDLMRTFCEGLSRNCNEQTSNKLHSIVFMLEAIEPIAEQDNFSYLMTVRKGKRKIDLIAIMGKEHPLLGGKDNVPLHMRRAAKLICTCRRQKGRIVLVPEEPDKTLGEVMDAAAAAVLERHRVAMGCVQYIDDILARVNLPEAELRGFADAVQYVAQTYAWDKVNVASACEGPFFGPTGLDWENNLFNGAKREQMMQKWVSAANFEPFSEDDCFTLSRERHFTDEDSPVLGEHHWARYDGYGGRYAVTISTYKSGYRHIQIFVCRNKTEEWAPFLPEMYVEKDDITPVRVSIELPRISTRFNHDDKALWAKAKYEVDLAMKAAREIERRFMRPYIEGVNEAKG